MSAHRSVIPLAASVLLGSILALATPTLALESGWAETEGGRMQLVIDPEPRADGTILGVLDVALEPGWKTYWRDPGSAGIPPTLDFSQSRGIAFEALHYPAPVRVDDGYAVWAGYTAPVRFPLSFRRIASGSAEIRANAFIGICDKICVPFQAELSVDLPEGSFASDNARQLVDEALLRLPEPAGADFTIEEAGFEADGNAVSVLARVPEFRPAGAAPELFVAGPQGFAFAPPVLESDDGSTVRWRIHIEDRPEPGESLASVPVDFVVTLGQRAMGTSRQVAPASP